MTFWCAQERARAADGVLLLRVEDLDRARCQAQFTAAAMEDLRWFGLRWSEGPDVGGIFTPYVQSERFDHYASAWERLREGGFIYPCACSRKDVLHAATAPHDEMEEPIYPGTCRPRLDADRVNSKDVHAPGTWRFRVPDGESMSFLDERLGRREALAGESFGDFVVWRRDDVPAYQLAVVVDDAAMQISEVVRGEDLIRSTFRQLLLYRALGLKPPRWFHAPLLLDEGGSRLAKRNAALSLRAMRELGLTPAAIRDAGRLTFCRQPRLKNKRPALERRGVHGENRDHRRQQE